MRKTKIIPSFFVLFICSLYICAQGNFSQSFDFNRASNEGIAISPISDGLILVSASFCYDGQTQCTDITKFDFAGNVIWQKHFDEHPYMLWSEDGHGNHGFAGEDTEGNLYFSGTTWLPASKFDHFILKLDSNGEKMWLKKIGSAYIEAASTLLFDTDSTLLLFGEKETGTNIFRKIQLLFFDLNGKKINEFVFGANNSITYRQDIAKCANGDYVFSYFTCEDQSPCNFGGPKVLKLMRVTAGGQVKWEKDISYFDVIWGFNTIQELDDGRLVLSFNHRAENEYFWDPPILFWLDSLGEQQSITEFDGNFERTIQDLLVTDEGDIIGCGYINKIEEYRGWLFSYDHNGSLLWSREILDEKSYFKATWLNAIVEANNSLYGTGFILDSITINGNVFYHKDIWFLKVDSNGCFYQGCDSTEIITKIDMGPPPEIKGLYMYPNPSNGEITVTGVEDGTSYIISNTLGQIVQQGKIEGNKISIRTSGLLILNVLTAQGRATEMILVLDDW